MKKKLFSIIMTMILVFSLVGCSNDKKEVEETPAEPMSRTEIFMGTVVKVTLYDGQSEETIDKVFDRVVEIEDLVSINKEGTELDELNNNAGKSSVKLSDTSYEIIEKGVEYSKLAEGGYDLTIGPLVKLWSIGLPEAKVPTEKEIQETTKLIDYSKVQLNPETKEAYLSEEGMLIDLGSIAKGYAADEIVKILKEEGVTQAIVDLGGNIFAMGLKEGNKNWKIGIQNPFDNRGSVVGSVQVTDKSVVTSGIYERFLEKDGVKYHHILNPRTGYPYETDIVGVSIIADKSIDADALSTLVFTKGIEEGIKFVEKLDGVDAIFINKDNEVYITDGLKDNFKMINESFKLMN